MLGFLKPTKKKADAKCVEYRRELEQLRLIADDQTVDADVRAEALRKLEELAGHHTRKINGHTEAQAAALKEDRCDDSPGS